MAIEATAADGAPFAVEEISYANHAVFTGPATFTETGTVRLAPATRSTSPAVSDGTLGPSADPALLHGAVFVSVVDGRGPLPARPG